MLRFSDKQLTVKNLYLFVILVISSCIAAWLCLSWTVQSIDYNFVYRIAVHNSTSSLVTNSNWSIRIPVENETLTWVKIEDIALPPYSNDEVTLSIDGTQIYPKIADAFLKQLKHPENNVSGITNDLLSMQDVNNWVHLQLSYEGVQSQPLNIRQLLKAKKGDCTEFTLLAYYKLLSQGYSDVIPVEGFHFSSNQNRIVTPSNFHAWLLVKIDREWWVLDPLYKEITKPSSEYIVMNLMREGMTLPLIKNSNLSVKLK